MSRNETTGHAWNEVSDATFFRITGELFSHAFLAGASALLSTYDDDAAESQSRTETAVVPAALVARTPATVVPGQ